MSKSTGIQTSRRNVKSSALTSEVITGNEPYLLPKVADAWPVVKQALVSPQSAIEYLNQFYNGRPTNIYEAPPEANGRLHYNETAESLNFKLHKRRLDDFLDEVLSLSGNDHAKTLYNSSSLVDAFYPGFNEHNSLTIPFEEAGLSGQNTRISIWMGNKTVASCHYDALDNIAVCVAGKRRFTLFPPEQVHNLYPGPLYPTPGGQVISMVDFSCVDYARYPKFRKAEKQALVFELEAGDAIFIPAMWWHHVEGLSDFNGLVNYWWNPAPAYLGKASDCLEHAILAIRDLPANQKAAWKHLFDYYVFADSSLASSHIPEPGRGFLNPLDEYHARQLRAIIMNKLNR